MYVIVKLPTDQRMHWDRPRESSKILRKFVGTEMGVQLKMRYGIVLCFSVLSPKHPTECFLLKVIVVPTSPYMRLPCLLLLFTPCKQVSLLVQALALAPPLSEGKYTKGCSLDKAGSAQALVVSLRITAPALLVPLEVVVPEVVAEVAAGASFGCSFACAAAMLRWVCA